METVVGGLFIFLIISALLSPSKSKQQYVAVKKKKKQGLFMSWLTRPPTDNRGFFTRLIDDIGFIIMFLFLCFMFVSCMNAGVFDATIPAP